MFTGITETTAKVISNQKTKDGQRICIKPKMRLKRLKRGQSILVNGVCLTIVSFSNKGITFDVVYETLNKTNLKECKLGYEVNIERALRYGDRFDGHYVLGHIEAVGRITKVSNDKRGIRLWVKVPSRLMPRLIYKGCVALNGVSLTISKVKPDRIEVCLVPYTVKSTTFGRLDKGFKINIETDILFKGKKIR